MKKWDKKRAKRNRIDRRGNYALRFENGSVIYSPTPFTATAIMIHSEHEWMGRLRAGTIMRMQATAEEIAAGEPDFTDTELVVEPDSMERTQ